MAFAAPLALGLTAAGGIMSGFSNWQQAKYQAGVAELNRKISLQNAAYERQVGRVEAQRVGMKYGQEIGRTRAIEGASNLDVTKGSPAAVQASEHALALQDQATTRANAARRAYGYETQATQYEAQRKLANAKAAWTIPSSIIGTASSVADKWMMGSMTGLFPSEPLGA